MVCKYRVCFEGISKPLRQLLPNLSCFLAQAADSDSEESDDLFVGPVGTLDLTPDPHHPPKTTQENDDLPEVQGLDITTYGESNLVAEPQKVKIKPRIIFCVYIFFLSFFLFFFFW